MSSITFLSFDYIFDLGIPIIYCFERPESFLDKEDSFPREDGLKAGNYSIFFREFFLIKVGLFYTLLASLYRYTTKLSKSINTALYIAVS